MVLNALSFALSHIVQTQQLNSLGTVLVVGCAVLNAIASAFLAWRLVNS